jgi:hypothetical protein
MPADHDAAKLAAWRDLAKAQARLLALYRVGAGSGDRRAPPILDAITDAKARLVQLGEEL